MNNFLIKLALKNVRDHKQDPLSIAYRHMPIAKLNPREGKKHST